MANIEKLRAVLAKIEADPTLWDQAFWIKRTDCGTAGCFAGWACMLDGAKPIGLRHWDEGVEQAAEVITSAGVVQDVDSAAAEILDLTEPEADILFYGDNTLDDLRAYVDAIAVGNLQEVHEDRTYGSCDDNEDTTIDHG
jgi:hypothetical protein